MSRSTSVTPVSDMNDSKGILISPRVEGKLTFKRFICLRDANPVPRTVQMTFLQLNRLVHNESSLI